MLVLAMQFSRSNSECCRQTRQVAPSKRNRGSARVDGGGRNLRHASHRIASDQLRSSYREIGVGLLRKEVIQPHLPVRLPCYDFTPIANPTFDGSLPKGLGHRLRVLPTFVV